MFYYVPLHFFSYGMLKYSNECREIKTNTRHTITIPSETAYTVPNLSCATVLGDTIGMPIPTAGTDRHGDTTKAWASAICSQWMSDDTVPMTAFF